ncbi:MAG TPA: glycosyltransferase [Saprospiraceae bacterium]|nr:glycosyltransferase [Saprospiraceae bacterium]
MLNKYVLNTYGNVPPEDGLSNVFHMVKTIAPMVDDTNEIQEKSVILVAGIPFLYSHLLSPHHVNICFTTYEFAPLPYNWIMALNVNFMAVVVPHESVKKFFLSSGVQIPIYVVGQGHTYLPKVHVVDEKKEAFVMGFLGVPVPRKNLDLVIKAIEELSEVFPILIKVHISSLYEWFEDKDFINRLKSHPLVLYSEGYKTKEEIANWYQSLGGYIFPSSGEGWSFTPRESLSLAIPTIISNIPVHEDLIPFCCMIEKVITVDSIKAAILKVKNDILVYKEKAVKGQNWILNQYKENQMNIALLKIMDKYASFEY